MANDEVKDRLNSPANQKGVVNCCAALRRLLEQQIRSGDFTGYVQMQVCIKESTIQSYRSNILLPVAQ